MKNQILKKIYRAVVTYAFLTKMVITGKRQHIKPEDTNP